MALSTAKSQEAYAFAQQALADGEMVLVVRIGWDEPIFGGKVFQLPEPGAVIQAVESAGWALDRLEAVADNSTNRLIALFRRDLR